MIGGAVFSARAIRSCVTKALPVFDVCGDSIVTHREHGYTNVMHYKILTLPEKTMLGGPVVKWRLVKVWVL